MADVKFSELSPVTPVDPAAVVPVVQGGTNRSATVNQIGLNVVTANLTNLFSLGQWGPQMWTNAPWLLQTPGTTIAAVTKFYTVPAGYQAVCSNMQLTTGATGPVSTSIFVMTDSTTVPTANDRFYNFVNTAANSSTNALMQITMDEGWSMWAFATVNNEVTLLPQVQLYKKPLVGGTFTTVLQKQLAANTDVLLYTSGAGWTFAPANGTYANTTGTAITVNVKVLRVSDGATFFIVKNGSVAANAHTAFAGTNALLGPGDKLYINAATAGLNLSLALVERSLV